MADEEPRRQLEVVAEIDNYEVIPDEWCTGRDSWGRR